MRQWLEKNYLELATDFESTPRWLQAVITKTAFADPWRDEARFAIKGLLQRIKFPTKKPAAFLTIDDRAVCFKGVFPKPESLLDFKPWNKG